MAFLFFGLSVFTGQTGKAPFAALHRFTVSIGPWFSIYWTLIFFPPGPVPHLCNSSMSGFAADCGLVFDNLRSRNSDGRNPIFPIQLDPDMRSGNRLGCCLPRGGSAVAKVFFQSKKLRHKFSLCRNFFFFQFLFEDFAFGNIHIAVSKLSLIFLCFFFSFKGRENFNIQVVITNAHRKSGLSRLHACFLFYLLFAALTCLVSLNLKFNLTKLIFLIKLTLFLNLLNTYITMIKKLYLLQYKKFFKINLK